MSPQRIRRKERVISKGRSKRGGVSRRNISRRSYNEWSVDARGKKKTKRTCFLRRRIQPPKVPAQFNSHVVGPARYITGYLENQENRVSKAFITHASCRSIFIYSSLLFNSCHSHYNCCRFIKVISSYLNYSLLSLLLTFPLFSYIYYILTKFVKFIFLISSYFRSFCQENNLYYVFR